MSGPMRFCVGFLLGRRRLGFSLSLTHSHIHTRTHMYIYIYKIVMSRVSNGNITKAQ